MAKKYTIALLTSLLTNALAKDIYRGVSTYIGEDIDLITFTGGAIGEKHIDWVDLSGNIIYDLISPERFDGIIIYGGAIGQFIPLDEFVDFCRKFQPIPLVNISLDSDKVPSITPSNYEGVYDLVQHLIKFHNYRNIAFIKGPDGHDEAESRLKGYKDALIDNSITIHEEYITEGQFSVWSGQEGIKELLDNRGLKLDAVVCVDDDTAIGAIRELKRRKITVPDEIAVVGFDDVDLAISTIPTLTTVKQSFVELGKEAAKLLIKIINGDEYSKYVKVPSVPVIRDSCGCFEDVFFEENLLVDNQLLNREENIHKRLLDEFKDRIVLDDLLLDNLIECVKISFQDTHNNKLFMKFNTFLSNQDSISKNIEVLNKFVLFLVTYTGQFHKVSNSRSLLIIEELRVKLYIGAYRERLLENIFIEETYFDINNINQMLHHNITFKELYDDTFRFFNSFGVKGCYIVLYKELNRIGDEVELVFGFKDNTMFEIKEPVTFPSSQLLPDKYLSLERSNTVVTSLSSDNEAMGYIIFDMGELSVDISHALSWYYSSIYKRNIILDDSRQKTIQLEKALSTLKKTQEKLIESERLASLGSLVAGVAHEINTPLGTSITYSSFIEDRVKETLEAFREGELTRSLMEKNCEMICSASDGLTTNLNKVANLIKSFKDVAIFDDNDLKEFCIVDVIKAAIYSLKPSLGVGEHIVSLNCPEDLVIKSYKSSVAGIFSGLITNSIAHGFNNEKHGNIVIDIERKDDEVVISYKDDGIGIPKESAKKVFDPFFTTKRGMGFIGLGLHTIYNIINQQLHGSIELRDSEIGVLYHILIPIDSSP